MSKPIKVFIVDDHPLVRRGVAVCLARHEDIKLVGETGDSREVLSLANVLRPHVILMDIGMPYLSGLTVIAQLRSELPHIKVLVLSILENVEYLHQAMEAGAHGYIIKGVSCAEMSHAVRTVYRGELYFNFDTKKSVPEQSLRESKDGDQSNNAGLAPAVLV